MTTKTNLYTLFFIGLLSSLISCKNVANQKKTPNIDTTKIKLEEITAHTDTSQGGMDVFFRIFSNTTTDSSHIYIGKGLYNGNTVGLKFEVKSLMTAGLTDTFGINKKAFFDNSNCIKISSIGTESDAFVKALSELYNFPTTKSFSNSVIVPITLSMNQQDVDLDKKDCYTFKLFFEDNTDSLECELFLNIDLTKDIIELDEKDEDYRENIIKEFTK